MATIFPLSASVGQVFDSYTFDGESWNLIGNQFNPTSFSPTEPTNPKAGDLWVDSDSEVDILNDTNLVSTSDLNSYLTIQSASTTYATKAYADNSSSVAAAALVDAAPSTLNTLNELAAALGDDANFATTVTTSLSNKLDISSASTTYATKSSPTFTGTANFESASVIGILDVAEVREMVVSNSFSTNVMTANYNDGAIHYATVAPTGNFTISLTNVPTTTSKSITMSFLITQGSTGYIPTTLNLNGSSQTIRWVGGSAPTPTSSAGKIDIFNFTLILAASNVVIASANLNI